MNINHLGLGTMGMNFHNEASSIEAIHEALKQGITFFNTGDFYQNGESQVVLGKALKGIPRDQYFVSLKFGVTFKPEGCFLDVKCENIRNHLLASLKAMELDYVDLYQPARQDTTIPVEDIMHEMKKLIDEGLIKHIGLSEVDSDTLRRAHKIHPVYAVEIEYSLLDREIEQELIQTANELGIKVVIYGALGHGLLTEKILNGGANNPMLARTIFNENNKENNLANLNKFKALANSLDLSMSDLALAWTQAKYDNIISLVGTTKASHLNSAIKAINTKLDQEVVMEVENLINQNTIKGAITRKWTFTNGVGKLAK